MKKLLLPFILILSACVALSPLPARASAIYESDTADWTVLFYLCGADLESKYGYATQALGEIGNCTFYRDVGTAIKNIYHQLNGETLEPVLQEPGRVRVAIQTGGCKRWRAGSIGMTIAADRLQRWEHHMEADKEGGYPDSEYRLMDELPLESMADPETLRDFIIWGTENYPAKKYALVLWGHGGGGKSGVLTDELFDGDRLNLFELHQALSQSGVTFEAVVFDACMMASIETACAIQDHARWMVASEEVVAGQGSDVGSWLQQLYFHPECNGKLLGRWICDMTQIRYGNEEDQRSQDLLTWSVIDLSKIPRLAEDVDQLIQLISQYYAEDSYYLNTFLQLFEDTEHYGEDVDGMIDLAGIFYNDRILDVMEIGLYRDTLDALADAVVYCVRGNGRTAAMGLSFCYAPDFNNRELDIFSLNCASPHYLAFLDALSPTWTAPKWVYAEAERLPEAAELKGNRISMEKYVTEDGVPCIDVDAFAPVSDIEYRLYWKNEKSGQSVLLGGNTTKWEPVRVKTREELTLVYFANEPWKWPSVEKNICSVSLIENTYYGNVYSIPLQIGVEFWNLRCGYDWENETFKIYGLWEGYEADSSVLSRNVMSLSQFAGRDYRLIYPVDGGTGPEDTQYEAGERMTMYRSLRVEIMPLPPGNYEIEYVVIDRFYRPITLERIEMIWDGEKAVFTGMDEWTGGMEAVWTGWPEDQE